MSNHNFFNILDPDISINRVSSVMQESMDGFWKTKIVVPNDQIFFILEGTYNMYIGNEFLRVKENDVLFLPKGVNYRATGNSGHFSYIGIYFTRYESDEKSFFDTYHHMPNLKGMKNHFREVKKLFWGNREGKNLKMKKQIYSILDNLVSAEFSENNPYDKNFSTIKPATDYIEDNYTTNDISCIFLANLCNVTPTHLARLFKKIYNTTPKEYMIRLRMKRAEEYLIYSAYSVTEISSLLGYSDPAYFSAAFKRIYGVSPSAYRKKYL